MTKQKKVRSLMRTDHQLPILTSKWTMTTKTVITATRWQCGKEFRTETMVKQPPKESGQPRAKTTHAIVRHVYRQQLRWISSSQKHRVANGPGQKSTRTKTVS